jgi:diadenosine tetraphosphate (Ap4A) HIT family hydrolase
MCEVDADCYACEMNSKIGTLPPREQIVVDRGWRAAHAFDSSLAGWLVLVPTRHVAALHELTDDEAAAMGDLLVRLSKALRDVVGCEKTYSMLFAEAAGFGHVHFHVVPRMASFQPTQIGPQVFAFLGASPSERISEVEQDELAERLAEAIVTPANP